MNLLKKLTEGDENMKVNIGNLQKLIEEKFDNNKTKFAETIGISREYISKILNEKENNDSSKLCNAIILFCESNNLNYKDYIFLS